MNDCEGKQTKHRKSKERIKKVKHIWLNVHLYTHKQKQTHTQIINEKEKPQEMKEMKGIIY